MGNSMAHSNEEMAQRLRKRKKTNKLMINFGFSYVYDLFDLHRSIPFYNVHFEFRLCPPAPSVRSSIHFFVYLSSLAAVETTISIVNLCVFSPFVLFVFQIILSFASSSPSSSLLCCYDSSSVSVCVCVYLYLQTSLLCICYAYIAHTHTQVTISRFVFVQSEIELSK